MIVGVQGASYIVIECLGEEDNQGNKCRYWLVMIQLDCGPVQSFLRRVLYLSVSTIKIYR